MARRNMDPQWTADDDRQYRLHTAVDEVASVMSLELGYQVPYENPQVININRVRCDIETIRAAQELSRHLGQLEGLLASHDAGTNIPLSAEGEQLLERYTGRSRLNHMRAQFRRM